MEPQQSLLVTNLDIYTEKGIIKGGTLFLNRGKIEKVYVDTPSLIPGHVKLLDGKGLCAVPGFIDGHIHGANGADVMDATPQSIDTIAGVLPSEGTTSFLATTITQSTKNLDKALTNLKWYENKRKHAEMLGIHLEGPFVEKEKAGAQPKQYIIKPDLKLFNRWQGVSGNKIKTITVAPELDVDGSFLTALHKSSLNISAGHTNINYDDMKLAVSRGVRQLTHLCNAMTSIHHRDIGAVGAAFKMKELRAEIIADGIHVSKEMLDLVFHNIGSDRLILITDSMRAKGLSPGDYELGGQLVKVSKERAVLENGILAGSVLRMIDAVKLMLKINKVTFEDVIKMTSVNIAKQLNIFHKKGSIAVGKDADLLLVDHDFNIFYTICRGEIAYKGGSSWK
ncbi:MULTISPECIES: N-acetylglucosamine-6-phosphate deacetylase [Bacillaceae]|uniref:N-acetylglucosamine-6-phosphate deacetylase n=1 Tax=Evansella alkalicola TaxID=745819 RepID=A0ABS6JYT3_9BACI|nr:MULTISPECIES: N-acetylglucosamine-6-phosphate deacetylase [Bacillaceae]MBU9722352.1 N-acetylglucosamine-6-phosphate deacetylase [Bacillus alkalicola]